MLLKVWEVGPWENGQSQLDRICLVSPFIMKRGL